MKTDSSSILITGLGAFGAGGKNTAELWENCRAGRATAQWKDLGDQQVPIYAAPNPELSRSDAHLVRNAGRAAALALAAAREAWQQAGLTERPVDPARIGIVIGSSRGPADVVDAAEPGRNIRPSEAVYTAFSSTPGILASALDIQGLALSVSATCTSGAAAIYTARQLLLAGELDVVLAGGVDSPVIPSILERMAAAGVLSTEGAPEKALRPFDVSRKGTVLGEGAAFLILESAASAARRGAKSHGTLLGAALNCEPSARTRPTEDCDGLQRAVRTVLKQGGIEETAIDMIHLHGTGTSVNDKMEGVAMRALFGDRDNQPVTWGTKGCTGHTLGAASSMQVVLSLMAMKHSFLPGTINCTDPDPACGLNISIGKGKEKEMRTTLCLTSGFWGKNSSLLLGMPEA